MNLLIVDDEFYYVEGLRTLLDWSQLGFEQVYLAYSMQQAQEVFQSNTIDIMISDIEMPKGSGLQLLEWVNENGYSTVTVFLTAYANFDYASSAIKLQSADYLLKPIDQQQLNECVLKAIKKVKQQQMYDSFMRHPREQGNSRLKLEEQFWNSLCTQVIQGDDKQMKRELKNFHLLPSLYYENFYIALLQAYIKNDNDKWEINLYEYAIKNVISEILEGSHALQVISRLNDQQYFLCFKAMNIPDRTFLIGLSKKIIEALSISLPGIFQIYIGDETSLQDIGNTFQSLNHTARNSIQDEHRMIDCTLPFGAKSEERPVFTNEWPDMLLQHKKSEVRNQALLYLSELQTSHTADRSDLIKFKHNFMQIIYSILEKKGESAHLLFSDSTSEAIFNQSCDSIETMKEWVTYVIDKFDECLRIINQSASSIETVKRYIREHIDEDLNRKKLASIVYVSPDYLSHIFSEKTGESLSRFILAERIKKSKELLLTTNLSIRDIALQSGFPNISYFSRQFKSSTGYTPQEYRKTPMK